MPKIIPPPRKPPSPTFARFNPGLVCSPVEAAPVVHHHHYYGLQTGPTTQRPSREDILCMTRRIFSRWAKQENNAGRGGFVKIASEWRKEHKFGK